MKEKYFLSRGLLGVFLGSWMCYIYHFFSLFFIAFCYVRPSRPSVPIFSFSFFHSFIRARWEKLFWRYHIFFVMAEVLLLFLLSPLVSIRSTGTEI